MGIHKLRAVSVVLLAILISGCSFMKNIKNDSQLQKIFKGSNFTLNYLLYIPSEYDGEMKFPLVLFLHGSGERGSRLEMVKRHGPPKMIQSGMQFPFILVSPQCPKDKRWDIHQLSELLDDIEEKYSIDKDRIYLTGLSMGGYGVWKMAQNFPDRFAAFAPVCGGGDFLKACVVKHIPAWVFHGAKDRVVFVQESERMVDALKRCGGNVKFTVYPEAEHDSWTETYENPELYKWMLRQKRTNL